MALNNPAPLSCQNIVSFDANKTPNITAVSGCNIGCRFCKCLVIKLICGKTGTLEGPSKPVYINCFVSRDADTATAVQRKSDTMLRTLLRGCFGSTAKVIITFQNVATTSVKYCEIGRFCNDFSLCPGCPLQREAAKMQQNRPSEA